MKMGKTFFYLAMVVALVLGSTGCSSDDSYKSNDNVLKNIGKVEDLKGTICYNDVLERWVIICHDNGSIDSVVYYFPMQLGRDYMFDGMSVVFSGFVYDGIFDIPKTGGASYYYIDLINIISE